MTEHTMPAGAFDAHLHVYHHRRPSAPTTVLSRSIRSAGGLRRLQFDWLPPAALRRPVLVDLPTRAAERESVRWVGCRTSSTST